MTSECPLLFLLLLFLIPLLLSQMSACTQSHSLFLFLRTAAPAALKRHILVDRRSICENVCVCVCACQVQSLSAVRQPIEIKGEQYSAGGKVTDTRLHLKASRAGRQAVSFCQSRCLQLAGWWPLIGHSNEQCVECGDFL